jgi:hypothetical protein
MSLRNQVLRAPNEKFYVIWRGQPVCVIDGVIFYFVSEREARGGARARTRERRREIIAASIKEWGWTTPARATSLSHRALNKIKPQE